MKNLLALALAAVVLLSACGGGYQSSSESTQKSALPQSVPFETVPVQTTSNQLSPIQGKNHVASLGITYYVRTDGGSATECNGKVDAPYPGSGVLQNCAWQSPHDALPTTDTPRISGGDTLIIDAGEYQVGWGAPGADGGRCDSSWKYDCHLSAVPSGPSPQQPTRILGKGHDGTCSAPPKLWGNERVPTVLNLADSSNVEIACLDITDKSICVGNHTNSNLRCVRGNEPEFGAYADSGIRAYRSNNVKLRDLNIHGLAYNGIQAGAVSNWTLERVRLLRNGYAGWDGDLSGIPKVDSSSNSGSLIFRNVEIAWNGCAEDPSSGEATGCYGQKNGGYGDGLGTAITGGNWLFEDVSVHHNTSDGLDMLYLNGRPDTSVTLNRVHAYSNAGNQIKVNGNAVVQNSVIVGECGYFYRQSQKYPYMGSGDHCRAGGTALSLAVQTNSKVDVTHNTITGEGDILIFHGAKTSREGNPMDDTGANLLIRNNILIGQQDFTGVHGELVAAHYWEKTKATTVYEGNVFFNVKNNQCPSGTICSNPMLTVAAMQDFDPRLQQGSPAHDKVAPIPTITTDFFGGKRPYGAAADIGAVETQPDTDTTKCIRSQPTLSVLQPPSALPAGASVTLSLTLKNNDNTVCGPSNFQLAHTSPVNWLGEFDVSALTLAPGTQASAQLSLKSATNASGVYSVPVRSASSHGSVHETEAVGVIQVRLPDTSGGVLSGGVVTDKVNYRIGDIVKIGAAVKRNGRPQRGATVELTIEGPNGVRWRAKSSTDENGMAWASYQLPTQQKALGHYYIYVKGNYPNAKSFTNQNRFDVRRSS